MYLVHNVWFPSMRTNFLNLISFTINPQQRDKTNNYLPIISKFPIIINNKFPVQNPIICQSLLSGKPFPIYIALLGILHLQLHPISPTTTCHHSSTSTTEWRIYCHWEHKRDLLAQRRRTTETSSSISPSMADFCIQLPLVCTLQ